MRGVCVCVNYYNKPAQGGFLQVPREAENIKKNPGPRFANVGMPQNKAMPTLPWGPHFGDHPPGDSAHP